MKWVKADFSSKELDRYRELEDNIENLTDEEFEEYESLEEGYDELVSGIAIETAETAANYVVDSLQEEFRKFQSKDRADSDVGDIYEEIKYTLKNKVSNFDDVKEKVMDEAILIEKELLKKYIGE